MSIHSAFRANGFLYYRFAMGIGERIAAARQAKGWTQPELAERCGWGHNQARISHYETGRREPDFEDMRTLEDTLGLYRGALIGAREPGEDITLAKREWLQDAINHGELPRVLEGMPTIELIALINAVMDNLGGADRQRVLAEQLQNAAKRLESSEP